MTLHTLTIHELQDMLAKGQVTAVEATRDVLDRIEKVEGKVNAYISLDKEHALQQAEAADKKLKDGTGGPLCGIPVSG
jgi:aspartyl-tRNA(Asn)/glutamyl-tRNA(Gln) amidotransferase subunit A